MLHRLSIVHSLCIQSDVILVSVELLRKIFFLSQDQGRYLLTSRTSDWPHYGSDQVSIAYTVLFQRTEATQVAQLGEGW